MKGDDDVSLRPDEVHVWLASLDLPGSKVVTFKRTLADEEIKRAERFHFDKDRDRFIVARGLLRKILGCYARKEPGGLQFRYSAYGKPELTDEADGQNVCFNVSHSHGLALYAVTHNRGIGVDIELIRPDFADEKIAERFFSTGEVATLRSLPKEVQPRAFFNCWTRKEAYLKALGDGLSRPLGDFEVSLVPGEPAKLLRVGWDPAEIQRWSLRELEPAFGYVGAIAVEGQDCRIVYRQWRDDPPDHSL